MNQSLQVTLEMNLTHFTLQPAMDNSTAGKGDFLTFPKSFSALNSRLFLASHHAWVKDSGADFTDWVHCRIEIFSRRRPLCSCCSSEGFPRCTKMGQNCHNGTVVPFRKILCTWTLQYSVSRFRITSFHSRLAHFSGRFHIVTTVTDGLLDRASLKGDLPGG